MTLMYPMILPICLKANFFTSRDMKVMISHVTLDFFTKVEASSTSSSISPSSLASIPPSERISSSKGSSISDSTVAFVLVFISVFAAFLLDLLRRMPAAGMLRPLPLEVAILLALFVVFLGSSVSGGDRTGVNCRDVETTKADAERIRPTSGGRTSAFRIGRRPANCRTSAASLTASRAAAMAFCAALALDVAAIALASAFAAEALAVSKASSALAPAIANRRATDALVRTWWRANRAPPLLDGVDGLLPIRRLFEDCAAAPPDRGTFGGNALRSATSGVAARASEMDLKPSGGTRVAEAVSDGGGGGIGNPRHTDAMGLSAM
eukprot:CAMPEP_0117621748 /NCGR_PEP_ID=MMETSP0784-20121206/87792_1 /TAXON_ID=39447 /ORGANISM="" /LENGTH=322 /DNA_ID=CAMNT_0005425679 /DNA_START=265 /DNA_END=1236 /DNA_ORIENTATION=+